MANYQSYKKIQGDQAIIANSVTASQTTGLALGNQKQLYVYNTSITGHNNGGCCCLWTVPAGTTAIKFELTGGGGSGGVGHCCANGIPGGSGAYAVKTLCSSQFTPGSTQYTICAGGSTECSVCGACQSCWCCGRRGCRSYVTGSGLSNFCANGGTWGWQQCSGGCHTCNHQRHWDAICVGTEAPFYGADFGIRGKSATRQQNNECRGDWWQFSADGVGPYGVGGARSVDMCTNSPWWKGCCIGLNAYFGGGGFSPYTDGSCCWSGWGSGGLVVVTYWS